MRENEKYATLFKSKSQRVGQRIRWKNICYFVQVKKRLIIKARNKKGTSAEDLGIHLLQILLHNQSI